MLQALSIFMACWEQENYMIRSLVVKSKEVVYIILLDGHCKLSYVRLESQSTKKLYRCSLTGPQTLCLRDRNL